MTISVASAGTEPFSLEEKINCPTQGEFNLDVFTGNVKYINSDVFVRVPEERDITDVEVVTSIEGKQESHTCSYLETKSGEDIYVTRIEVPLPHDKMRCSFFDIVLLYLEDVFEACLTDFPNVNIVGVRLDRKLEECDVKLTEQLGLGAEGCPSVSTI